MAFTGFLSIWVRGEESEDLRDRAATDDVGTMDDQPDAAADGYGFYIPPGG